AEGDEKRDRLLASGHEVILGQATASSAPTTVSSVRVVCATFATFTFHASPRRRSALMPIQFRSSSYQARPWRAETGCAWWLLCQPSPNVMSATHQLLVESSRVVNRREPHKWVAEFTSQVQCRPKVVLKKIPHNTYGMPPNASRPSPTMTFDTQCQVDRNTWTRSRHRSGTYLASTAASWCIPSPVRIHPMWAHQVPSRGVCGSPSRSDFWWWMRCVATQKIGPPSSASVPQKVRKYST